MATKVFFLNSDLADYGEEEFNYLQKFLLQQGVLNTTGANYNDFADLAVIQHSAGDMTVDVKPGVAIMNTVRNSVSFKIFVSNQATANLAIANNTSGSNRVDAVVMKISRSTQPNALMNNVATLQVVTGSGVSALTDNAIQTALGADYDFIRLANITVANNATQILTASIADARTRCYMTDVAVPSPTVVKMKLLAGNLSTPAEGEIWFNGSNHKLLYYNGTSIIELGGATGFNPLYVQPQATADMTVKITAGVVRFPNLNVVAKYAGGNSPAMIKPQLSGDLAMALNPANGETVVINGVTFTFVSSIGSTAGNVLIGATLAATMTNLTNAINYPSVTNATQVALSAPNQAIIAKVNATNNTTAIFIKVIDVTQTTLTVTETMAGAGNTWTANTTKHRIDLVVLNSSAAIEIIRGIEAVSPATPDYPVDKYVTAEIYHKNGETVINATADGTNGYIQTDVRYLQEDNGVGFPIGEPVTAGKPVFMGDGSYVPRAAVAMTTDPVDYNYKAQFNSNAVYPYAQTFVQKGSKITGVRLPIWPYGGAISAGTNLTIAIRAVSGNVPTGSDLISQSFSLPALTYTGNDYWLDFDFTTPLNVTDGASYAIIMYSTSGQLYFYIPYNNTDVYSGGNYASSSNSGASWTADTTKDFPFVIKNDVQTTAGQVYLADELMIGSLANNVIGITQQAKTVIGDTCKVEMWLPTGFNFGNQSDIITETIDTDNGLVADGYFQLYSGLGEKFGGYFFPGNKVGNISKISVYFQQTGSGGGTVDCNVYEITSDPVDKATFRLIGTKQITPTGSTYNDFVFATPLIVKPRKMYVFLLQANGGNASNSWNVGYKNYTSGAGSPKGCHLYDSTNAYTMNFQCSPLFKTYYTKRVNYEYGDSVYLGTLDISLTDTTNRIKIGKIISATQMQFDKSFENVENKLYKLSTIYPQTANQQQYVWAIPKNTRQIRVITPWGTQILDPLFWKIAKMVWNHTSLGEGAISAYVGSLQVSTDGLWLTFQMPRYASSSMPIIISFLR